VPARACAWATEAPLAAWIERQRCIHLILAAGETAQVIGALSESDRLRHVTEEGP
jgi:hypothetical protein